MQGTKLRFKTTELWFKMSVEDTMRTIKGKPFQRNNARGNVVAGSRSDFKIQTTSRTRMLLMQAQENGAVLDEEQSLFLVGEQVTNFDDDVDESPENDLALNVDHIFEADLVCA
ncbi:hypothetical protein Tco_0118251 [Tanacetum coccineum]